MIPLVDTKSSLFYDNHFFLECDAEFFVDLGFGTVAQR